MTQTTFTDNVVVDGSQDITQLDVQGHSSQTNPLQTWKDSSGTVLAEVLGDGRIHAGDDLGSETEDALIEVHRKDTSVTKPERGLNLLGRIVSSVAAPLTAMKQWVVQELELTGSQAIAAIQTALRTRVVNKNTADSSSAGEIRAAEFESVSEAGTLKLAVGVRADVTAAVGSTINEAIGLEVAVNEEGTITDAIGIKINDVGENNVALQIGTGKIGIGTATPDSKLDVAGDLTFHDGIISMLDGSANTPMLASQSGGYWRNDNGIFMDLGTLAPHSPGLFMIGTHGSFGGAIAYNNYREYGTNNRIAASDFDGYSAIRFESDGKIKFTTGNQPGLSQHDQITSIEDRLVIDENGDIGIGLINPAGSRLYVSDSHLNVYTSNGESGGWSKDGLTVYANPDVGYSALRVTSNHSAVSDRGLLNVDRQGNSYLHVRMNGKVGIGTVGPQAQLHIDGTSELLRLADTAAGSPFISFFQTTTRRAYIQLNDSGNTLKIASEYGPIALLTNSDGAEMERMRIQSDGRVGIGTTSPSYPLHIHNTNTGINGYVTIVDANSDPGYLFGEGLGTSQYGYMLWLRASNRIRMGIGGDGDKFYIESGRLLSMVDFDPATNNLQVIGNGAQRWKEIYVNAVYTSSDRRRKDNIQDAPIGLDFINALRPVSYQEAPYTWIDENGEEHIETPDDKLRFGLIAQEVMDIVQDSGLGQDSFEAIRYDQEHDAYSINYIQLVPILIRAVQELSAKVQTSN